MKEIFRQLRYSKTEVDFEIRRLKDVFGHSDEPNIFLDPPGIHPKRYVLATTSRTGCSYLCSVLNRLCLGMPAEYFNASTQVSENFSKYFSSLITNKVYENEVFGIKLTISNLIPFMQYDNMPFSFYNWAWVYVTREDLVDQAISLYLAVHTGGWNSYEPGMPPETVDYSYADILDNLKVIAEDNKRWEMFFSLFGITPLRITYTEIDSNVMGCANRILKKMNLEQDTLFNNSRLKKQATSINAEFKKRFVNEARGNLYNE
jgi:LPS sulfotransferase NodH